MTKDKLIEQRSEYKTQAETLISTAETENRILTEDEQVELDMLKEEISKLDVEIGEELKNAMEAAKDLPIEDDADESKVEEPAVEPADTIPTEEIVDTTHTEAGETPVIVVEDATEQRNYVTKTIKTKMENKFSLLKAINDVANNRQLDETSLEVVNAGIAEMRKSGQNFSGQIVMPMEMRAINATTATEGAEVVAEDKMGILEPLRNALVMVQAGATYLNGLIGNVSIPVYSGSNVAWAGETAAAADGAGAFSEVSLSPKRLTAFVDVSKQFLIQDSANAEAMLKADIVRAISEKLESTILGAAAGSATTPAGLFNVVAPSTIADYSDVVDMEEALELANVGGNVSYLVHPSAKAVLRTTAVNGNGSRFILENGEINGLKAYTSTGVNTNGIVLGNFADYVIAQWGGIDLTVDPYSQAANGMVRLVINAYFDAKPRRAESFVTATATAA